MVQHSEQLKLALPTASSQVLLSLGLWLSGDTPSPPVACYIPPSAAWTAPHHPCSGQGASSCGEQGKPSYGIVDTCIVSHLPWFRCTLQVSPLG